MALTVRTSVTGVSRDSAVWLLLGPHAVLGGRLSAMGFPFGSPRCLLGDLGPEPGPSGPLSPLFLWGRGLPLNYWGAA